MKTNRRSFLQALALLPVVPSVLKLAIAQPKAPVPLPERLVPWESTEMGSLTVVLGFPKTGKTCLARAFASRGGVSFDPEIFNEKNEELISDRAWEFRRRGFNVLVTLNCNRTAVVQDSTLITLGSSRHFKLANVADRMAFIRNFTWHDQGAEWELVTLKDRYDAEQQHYSYTASREEMWLTPLEHVWSPEGRRARA